MVEAALIFLGAQLLTQLVIVLIALSILVRLDDLVIDDDPEDPVREDKPKPDIKLAS